MILRAVMVIPSLDMSLTIIGSIWCIFTLTYDDFKMLPANL